MEIEDRALFELYRNGLRVGIRRGAGQHVVAAFNRLWEHHQDFFIEQELQMVAIDESWGGLLNANETSLRVKSLLKDDPEEARLEAFAFIKKLASSQGNRSPYYLMRLLTEPWVNTERVSITRQIPKKEWALASKTNSRVAVKTFWTPLINAATKNATKEYITICKGLYSKATIKYDRQLAAIAAIMALMEPSIPSLDKAINHQSVRFNHDGNVSWNWAHPDSYVGGYAMSEVAKILDIRPKDIRIVWLTKYVDREIHATRSFWQSVYTKRAYAKTYRMDWHIMAVHLMAVCKDWINGHVK